MSRYIPRDLVSPEEADRLDYNYERSIRRRAENRQAGRCVNDTVKGTHGPATVGVRCHRCALVYKYGAKTARLLAEYAE